MPLATAQAVSVVLPGASQPQAVNLRVLNPGPDRDLILSTLTHPAIYDKISDDKCPPCDQFDLGNGQVMMYVGAWAEDVFLGLWGIKPLNGVTVEVHTCLLPLAAGSKGLAAAIALKNWLFADRGGMDIRRIETTVPETNKLALRFAERAGMIRYGMRPKSYLKDGVLHNEILLGLSRPESGGDQCQR